MAETACNWQKQSKDELTFLLIYSSRPRFSRHLHYGGLCVDGVYSELCSFSRLYDVRLLSVFHEVLFMQCLPRSWHITGTR